MRGGARNYFPLPTDITDGASLAGLVSFINVVGHGSLNGRIFTVPPNTFILFMGAAGMPIYRRAHQLEQLRDYRFLKDGETVPQYFNRQYEAIQNHTFFSKFLFTSNAPFAANTTAIYEPGDIVQDLGLSFENNAHPYMLLGVWNCPIDAELRKEFDNTNQQLQIAREEFTVAEDTLMEIRKRAVELASLPPGTLHLHHDELEELTAKKRAAEIEYANAAARYETLNPKGKALQDKLPEQENNIAFKIGLDGMSHSSLHEVIYKLDRNPAGTKPIRFIVVEACRSIGDAQLENQNLISHVMRAPKSNFEHSAELRKQFLNFEKRAHIRRRASLLARQLVPGSSYLMPAFTYNMSSLSRIPQAAHILHQLASGAPAELDELETKLAEFTHTGKALIDADLDALVAGLPPQKHFKPGDLVKVSPAGAAATDFNAFVIGPEGDAGFVRFKVARIQPDGTPKIVTVTPLLMKKSDEDPDELRALFMSHEGFNLELEIEKYESERLLALTRAREANVAFGSALPAAAAAAVVGAGVPKLYVAWAGDFGSNIGKGGILQRAWNSADPSKLFNPGTRVVFDGQLATIRGIGVVPDGVADHAGKLQYSVELDSEPGKTQKVLAEILNPALKGGRRCRSTKRRSNAAAKGRSRRSHRALSRRRRQLRQQ